jgi:hypothetical protein
MLTFWLSVLFALMLPVYNSIQNTLRLKQWCQYDRKRRYSAYTRWISNLISTHKYAIPFTFTIKAILRLENYKSVYCAINVDEVWQTCDARHWFNRSTMRDYRLCKISKKFPSRQRIKTSLPTEKEEKLSLYNVRVLSITITHVLSVWKPSKNKLKYGLLQKIQIWVNVGI